MAQIETMKSKFNYPLPENLAKNLIFIDGIPRCGKSLFSSIISSFESMEHIQFFNLFEQVIPSVKLGGTNIGFAKSLLRISLNELAYDLQLSRNVNFRADDQTGIDNYKEPGIYRNRLKVKEGDEVVDFIRNHEILIPFQTHDLMVNLDIVDDLQIDYKMIELYRNPIDNLYSWWTRGWGERFCKDPRAFTLLISHGEIPLPWYCAGYEEWVVDLNPYEKCCMIGMDLIRRSVEKQKNANHPERIMTIRFEEIVQRPKNQLKRISKFINKSETKFTAKFVSAARCPRVLDLQDRKRKLAIFKNNIDPKLFNELSEMAENYERDTYGLLSIN
jgi:hypothetical protein